ncbi:unnamed protein product [Spodoptera littoralis]|uniref:Uncharacterized protein n=1 Tax=Spodoptera littoralis TaxID=7109 RepID=A0A9P0MYH6_SPOLI|nr:unnamed protein product [Spodoptera littoralis]CAH1638042.1 unnamed protein product [Spodoptera littoralis]
MIMWTYRLINYYVDLLLDFFAFF